MNKRVKFALLCGAVSYVIAEYLVLRRESKNVPSPVDQYRYKWAAQMVLNEVHRGKYDRCRSKQEIMARMDADFVYYQGVADILEIKGNA